MKNILFVHQSSELYGSDKMLLLLVSEFKLKEINPIVVLPDKGPLEHILKSQDIEVVLTPVFKISRNMFGIKNICSLPFQVLSSLKTIDIAVRSRKIDLVYSNTLAVLLGFVYANRRKIKHIWHVHEIVKNPFIVKNIYQKLISLKTNDIVIYNSHATKVFWELQNAYKKSFVVWNGMKKEHEAIKTDVIIAVRKNVFVAEPNDVVIALVGRINKWKGQQLLLEAFKRCVNNTNSIKLIFVGSSPPNQEIYVSELQEKIVRSDLKDKVKIISFQNNIWPIWEAIDIAVVPSVLPEPFGIVTLEAMLCSKPVIASNHGGLSEIVVDDETGLLFEPNNIESLELALKTLINNKTKRDLMGKNGYDRATTLFTAESYVDKIEKICLGI